jgi:hypothetical protein
MIKKLLIGAGLVALGYLLGKAVARTETGPRGRLTWQGPPDPRELAEKDEPDAEFDAVAPVGSPADATPK